MERSRQAGKAGAVSSPAAVRSRPDCGAYHSSWSPLGSKALQHATCTRTPQKHRLTQDDHQNGLPKE
jgi:hypothetical protein